MLAAQCAYPASRYCEALWSLQGQAWQVRAEVLPSDLETGLASSEEPQPLQSACRGWQAARRGVPVWGSGTVQASRLQHQS